MKSRISFAVTLLSILPAIGISGCNHGTASTLVTPPPPPPPAISVTIGLGAGISVQINGSTQLTAIVNNDASNKGVTWTLTQNGTACSPACGTVSPTSTLSGAPTNYTAPSTVPANPTVTFTATSVADPTKSASSNMTIIAAPVSIGIGTSTGGTAIYLPAGGTVQLQATVSNDPTNKGVTWSLSCSACGSLSPTATLSGAWTTYTAPSTPPANTLTVDVYVTSVADPSASLEAAVVYVQPISVSVSPLGAILPAGIAQQFTATLANDLSAKGVTWALSQGGTACAPACGSIAPVNTASGNPITYTPPAKLPPTSAVTLTATSVNDTTKSSSTAITLSTGSVQVVSSVLNFGRELAHKSSAPQVATLTNTGNSALNITGIAFTGNNTADFSQSDTCNSGLGAGTSCTVSVTFNPGGTGSRSAAMSITDSSTDSPQQVSLSGTGYTRAEVIPGVRSAVAGMATAAVPSPTGPYSVGTRTIALTDSTRNDPYVANGTKRELAVRLWYPASPTQNCQAADYASPKVWNYFSQLLGMGLPNVTTNSCLDTPVMDGAHPVVVFTPGYTGTFSDYTFLFEDLASRGYVVASVAHTYETTVVELPDLGLVKGLFGSHLDDSWRGDEQTFSFATTVRLQDLTFVLNQLEQLNTKAGSSFQGKLDTARIAVAGHSMGGSTAILAVEQEPRFKAAIVIDGVLSHSLASSTETPVLLLAAGRDGWSDTERHVWAQLEGSRLAVNFKGAEHVTPTDEVWLAKDAVKTGAMGPEKTIAGLRDYVAAFLDAHLLNKPLDSLLTGPSSDYPDAEVTTQNQALHAKP
ncbi:MAG TPA: alpha/beta fold hydrolase [Candidatus Acidoferrum sp.]|nr:alpha/beta fold hydrolase [Candidatus Acidoferrum sp.]